MGFFIIINYLLGMIKFHGSAMNTKEKVGEFVSCSRQILQVKKAVGAICKFLCHPPSHLFCSLALFLCGKALLQHVKLGGPTIFLWIF